MALTTTLQAAPIEKGSLHKDSGIASPDSHDRKVKQRRTSRKESTTEKERPRSIRSSSKDRLTNRKSPSGRDEELPKSSRHREKSQDEELPKSSRHRKKSKDEELPKSSGHQKKNKNASEKEQKGDRLNSASTNNEELPPEDSEKGKTVDHLKHSQSTTHEEAFKSAIQSIREHDEKGRELGRKSRSSRELRGRSPGKIRDAKSPGRMRDAKSPGRMRDARSPGRMRDARSPGRMRDARSPGRTRDARSPGRARQHSRGKYSARGGSPGRYRGLSPGKYQPSVAETIVKRAPRSKSNDRLTMLLENTNSQNGPNRSTFKVRSKSFETNLVNEPCSITAPTSKLTPSKSDTGFKGLPPGNCSNEGWASVFGESFPSSFDEAFPDSASFMANAVMSHLGDPMAEKLQPEYSDSNKAKTRSNSREEFLRRRNSSGKSLNKSKAVSPTLGDPLFSSSQHRGSKHFSKANSFQKNLSEKPVSNLRRPSSMDGLMPSRQCKQGRNVTGKIGHFESLSCHNEVKNFKW